MDREHLTVLYREFLFRMVDRDLLSVHAQGDISKLLGRIAAILVWISIGFGVMAMMTTPATALTVEHSLIATTMLIVSLLCVVAWDSLLPERRDVFVLMPFGVSPATIFAAKAASLVAALSVAVAVFNGIPSVLFSLALAPPGRNLLEMIFSIQLFRLFAAYWLTMLLAGGFIFFSIVSIQAATAQLPRRAALRLSSLFQIATFCTAVGVYFLQPGLASTAKLIAPENQHALAGLPSYWFLGLFQQLGGTNEGPAGAILSALAQRAWLGLATVGGVATIALLATCFGTLRRIAEQPDIVPGRRQRLPAIWLGASPRAAIVQWTARTLVRSRQHRVLVAFYFGIGLAASILFLQAPVVHVMSRASAADAWRDLSLPLIAASILMTICWITGIRAAFAIPIELRANWIFQLMLTHGPGEPVAAARTSLYVVGVLPVWLAAAAAFLWLWPWDKAAQHLLVLGLAGFTLATLRLREFHKIPFTCAYLPGTSDIHITMALCIMLGLYILLWSANFERQALFHPVRYLEMAGVLAAAAAIAWWRLRAELLPDGLLFVDDAPTPAVQTLGLQRDGYALRP